jgi:ElaB/YqjD/DUF883 family membrane-anchored ribosome-binding protein
MGPGKNRHTLMNQESDLESDAIRSDIDTTRDRMDETINQLGNRLDGRHLVDEVLGFFRRSDGTASKVGQQISNTAQTAMQSVTNTVKENPIPALLIGGGIAWLIYSNTRGSSSSRDWDSDEELYSSSTPDYMRQGYAEGYTDQPLEQQSGSVASQAKEKLSELGSQAREKLSSVTESGREKFEAARGRVGEMTQQARQRSREVYDRTRQRVSTTANQHPLEVGLACLAVGLIAGLALPTPERVNRSLGYTADRLRERTREKGSEILDKGKRVVQAAADAAREEAKSQGLTPENLRNEAKSVASRASQAGMSAARDEGLAPPSGAGSSGSGQQSSGTGASV